MKKYEQKTHTIEVVSEMICDLCGKVSNHENWNTNLYKISETKIHYEEGTIDYDGGGECTKISIDICPHCFKNKLIPFLISNGVQIKEEDITF